MATNMVFMAVMVLLAAGAANVEAKTYKSIAQFLMKDKQSSLLLAAATAAGLVDTFKDTSLEVTVFAPSNRAINAALKELNITVEDLVADVDNLKNILLYHAYGDAAVRAGKVPSGSTVLTMLNGANLTVEKTTMMHKPMVTLFDSMMREVKVVRTNIKAGKSIIHIIDNVLLPPAAPAPKEPSPSPAADPSPSPAADPSPSPAADPSPAPEPSPSPAAVPDLFAALQAENLNTLSVVAGALFPMEVLTGLSNVTILAPTDAAFNELLAAAQGLGLEVDLANLTDTVKAVLTGILSTHIIPGQYKAADLTDGAVVTSLNEVEVAVDLKTPGSVIFRVVSVPSSTATVVKADIMADKGIVIHIIDKVLSNIDLSSLGK